MPSRKEAAAQPDRPAVVNDLDWDEDARPAEWQDMLAARPGLPAILRPASLLDA